MAGRRRAAYAKHSRQAYMWQAGAWRKVATQGKARVVKVALQLALRHTAALHTAFAHAGTCHATVTSNTTHYGIYIALLLLTASAKHSGKRHRTPPRAATARRQGCCRWLQYKATRQLAALCGYWLLQGYGCPLATAAAATILLL